jgi:hypothetical protein
MVHACVLTVDLRIPMSGSLKAKRAVVKHVVASCRSRFSVAAAEVGYLDQWQRSELAFAAVAGTTGHVTEVLDSVERFVWSQPEVEVLSADRAWLEGAA